MYLGYRNNEVFVFKQNQVSYINSDSGNQWDKSTLGGAIESKEVLHCICDCVTLI